jgi:hypothetical protein
MTGGVLFLQPSIRSFKHKLSTSNEFLKKRPADATADIYFSYPIFLNRNPEAWKMSGKKAVA